MGVETCERCQGNGEIVTDWERYLHPHEGDVGDEAVTDCPDCDGTGSIPPTYAADGQDGAALSQDPPKSSWGKGGIAE